jgi:hypothetical protein
VRHAADLLLEHGLLEEVEEGQGEGGGNHL